MKRRRLSRMAWQKILYRRVQRRRLEDIAAGRREPGSLREEFYLRMVQMNARPEPEQFILPRALFLLEEFELEATLDADQDEEPERDADARPEPHQP